MKKKYRWNIVLILALSLVSILVYFLQIRIFGRTEDTFFYMFQDLAFLPLQVLLVTLIVNELLKKRERKALLDKMNMAVGVYFTEMGNELLKQFSKLDTGVDNLQKLFSENTNWNDKFINKLNKTISGCEYRLDVKLGKLKHLKKFLLSRRSFLVSLLGNSNLLEHQSFTDLLWAVSHLTEELWLRKDVSRLSENDANHLSNDVKRAYSILLKEWLSYLRHLRDDYPYIFSLYARSNPFDVHAKIEFD